ncbi:transposase domain-containing protein [Mesorhizobium sp. VK4C]|nr:transposase domain-containing protein [Mesorhizobium sp. VK4C]MDX8499031.1 transposase domain-containing protein [Mesorhizobium sp. VK4C]
MSEQAPSTVDFLARIALLEAAVSARDITIAERDEQLRRERAEAALRIQRLQLQIDRFNRKAFGRSSEKLGQMLLELEDLDTDFVAGVPDAELPIVADTDKVRALPVRKLNPDLPRKRVVREPSCACCPGCGGALRAIGEDHEEMLDLVAQAWQVIETVRLFSGSFAAAERSAVVLSIIETCKLCGVDAEAYMADVIERIQNDWPASRWDELMPWNWVRREEMPLPLAA